MAAAKKCVDETAAFTPDLVGPTPVSRTPCPACGGTEFRHAFARRAYRFERCRGCGLLRIVPLPSAEELRRAYAAAYRDGAYERFARAATIRRAIAEYRFARLLRLCPRARRWLDVGASTGAFVAAVLAGVDPAAGPVVAEGIELAAEAAAEARAAGLAVSTCAIEDFTPAAPYDVVTAFDVLEHLRDPAVLLERTRSWLAPGGLLALTVPDLGSLPARLMGRFWYYVDPPGHLHYFDRGSLARLLGRHGYALCVLEPTHKILTLGYAVEVLRDKNPWLHRLAAAVAALLPAGMLERRRRLAIGELLAVATPER